MQHARRVTTVLGALALAGCAATDPALLSGDGQLLADLDPAPFRIGVLPVTMATGASAGSDLPLALDPAQLQQRFVADLQTLRAASEVVAVDEAGAATMDLVLRPRVTVARLGHLGSNSGALVSSLLWLTTWVGGLWIDDNDYQATLQVEWTVSNPLERAQIDELACGSSSARMAFFDRNGLLSFGTLQSILLPPFLTSDQQDRASATLTAVAAGRVAGQITGYLKSGLHGNERDLLGELRLDHPRNDSTSATAVCELRGSILARALVQGLRIDLNGEPRIGRQAEQLPSRAEQKRGSLYVVPVTDADGGPIRLDLTGGRNEIVITYDVDGQLTRRTVVVHLAERS